MKYLINGALYTRIKVGDSKLGTHDGECICCKNKGDEFHKNDCELETCPACGSFISTCNCGVKYQVNEITDAELTTLITNQKIQNIANDLMVKSKQQCKIKDNAIFKILSITKLALEDVNEEKQFESLFKDVIDNAQTFDEAVSILNKHLDVVKGRIHKQKNMEMGD